MKSPITIYGGKSRLASRIHELIPPDCNHYCEPFAGGAWVFFTMPEHLRKQFQLFTLSDLNDHLITFYRQCIENQDQLIRKLEATLYSESEYRKAREILKSGGSDLDVACAYFTAVNQSFGGVQSGWGYFREVTDGGRGHKKPTAFKNKIKNLESVSKLLKKVNLQVFCRDAFEVFDAVDSPGTLFYIDSPYYGSDQSGYRYTFTLELFMRLLSRCETLRGKFIMSHYERPELTAAIEKNSWHVVKIPTFTKTQRKKEALVQPREEWIVMNFLPKNKQKGLFEV